MDKKPPAGEITYNELPFRKHSINMIIAHVKDYARKVLLYWENQHKTGDLTSVHFDEFWKFWIPKVHILALNGTGLNRIFMEAIIENVLFKSFDDFICNGDSTDVLRRLSEMDKAPSTCGQVFRYGDHIYSCKECSTKQTCVLCMQCFQLSEHKNHKYTMGISLGGNWCECGDVEAWKKSAHCEKHIAGTREEERQKGLPEQFNDRIRVVFEAILQYAYRILIIEQECDINLRTTRSILGDNLFDNNTYSIILYNDDDHSNGQISRTLTKILGCDRKSCDNFLTIMEREGRVVLLSSTFQHCIELKSKIERYSSRFKKKPMKVLVNHTRVVIHQNYIQRLLPWLEEYLRNGETFRKIFASIILKPQDDEPCMAESLILKDSLWWKRVRIQWHGLLTAGMLLEYENKKGLAKIFAKNYRAVVKAFIDDNQLRCTLYPVLLQLFTVPSIAHHIIAHNDILLILLDTLISELIKKCNTAGKLEFSRPLTPSYKRTFYILTDLRQLLSVIPEKWTKELRQGFLRGLYLMQKVFTMMQGMDAVTRQVNEHVEYESEWKQGFELQIKLTRCISLAIKWCASDNVVLVKAYRSVLEKLEENRYLEIEAEGSNMAYLEYDVTSRPVSIHIPLTRFLIGLHLHLEKLNLHFDGSELEVIQILEPVVRTKVMIAQFHSDMWRRNGDALLNSLICYNSVLCRTEMLDRDITLLQTAAALTNSNRFLCHILCKFRLIEWTFADFEINHLKLSEEDSVNQVISLVEEFLNLLIVIIGERYVPGVSNVTVEGRIRKEIIQHLCIKPLSHSELIATIPEDLISRDSDIDSIIQEIAVFKKPTHGTGKGVYELKEQYYDEFNVFFYHYTREELSKAEESQRQRRKTKGEIECCPPPKLPKLTNHCARLVNLLQCDLMLHIMQTVLERSINLESKCYSESQLHKALYLIGYALLEQETKYYSTFKFTENASKFKLFPLLEELLTSPRVDIHKELLKWTLIKYDQVANNKKACGMLQKEYVSQIDNEKKIRAQLAAERRARLMEQMAKMRNNFIKQNPSLFEEASAKLETSNKAEIMDVEEILHDQEPIALGPNQSKRMSEAKTYVCIVCQEEEKVTTSSPSMVLAAFAQQATVFSKHPVKDNLKHDSLYLDTNLGPATHINTCGHVMHSECFRKYYNMKLYEYVQYVTFDIEKQEFLCPLCECLSNTVLPIIPSLSNLQPTMLKNDLTFDQWIKNIHVILSKKVKLHHNLQICDSAGECRNIHCSAWYYVDDTSTKKRNRNVEFVFNFPQLLYQRVYSYELSPDLPEKFLKLFSKDVIELDNSHKDMVNSFAQIVFMRGINDYPDFTDKRLAPTIWKSLAYTIHALEVLLRNSNKSLLGHFSNRQRDCIENFTRTVSVLGSTIPNSVFINSCTVSLLSYLFDNDNEDPSVLQWDSFGFLVSLTFSLPSLTCKYGPVPMPTGNTLDLYLLRIIFICHIVKILILLKSDFDSSMNTDEEHYPELLEILDFVGKKTGNIRSLTLWKYVQNACLPFLRCCALFYHCLTEVPAPTTLTEVGGDNFESLCSYLDLPQNPKQLFNSTEVKHLIKRWCTHDEVLLYLRGADVKVIEEPLPVPRLKELPTDYSDLISLVPKFECPKNDSNLPDPYICLTCGTVLCCCTFGHHTPADGCLFLHIRKCQILFFAGTDVGCHIPAPYVDDYGETDRGLERGNRLKLCSERYAKLHTLWLSHGIREEIVRSDAIVKIQR